MTTDLLLAFAGAVGCLAYVAAVVWFTRGRRG